MSKKKSYDEKRDFRKTPEPKNSKGKSAKGGGKKKGDPIFVIQEHDASSHHFDFRLEVEGTLKSWAVPKGPSTDPGEKRLAVPTEDHPLDYADFEGVIPEDEYGGGTVSIWDRGTYRNVTGDEDDEKTVSMSEGLKEGHVVVELKGEKLKGGYALQRFRGGKDEAWLLVKTDDEDADARRKPTKTEKESVASGRTIEEIADEEEEEEEEEKRE